MLPARWRKGTFWLTELSITDTFDDTNKSDPR